ncbi:MAG: DUF882 domain-containing protein [Pseudomonadota bacterium]
MRKNFNYISVLAVGIFLVSTPFANASLVKGKKLLNDGRIAIFNYHEKDYLEITYREDNKYNQDALKKIDYIMRSRMDGKTYKIDVQLIELLDHLQDHFEAETVELISGYRSPGYNSTLIENGRGAASESLHKKGLAGDIHLDEVSEETLFDYLKGLKVGGVGFYPIFAFVHADIGPHRTWMGAKPKQRVLMGTENNLNAAWTAVTDKNAYAPGSEAQIKITNNDYDTLKFIKNVWYERFRKGDWRERKNLLKEKKTTKLRVGEYTTFTWNVPEDQGLGKYRLVFFTSKDFGIPPVYSNEFYIRK